MDLSHAYSKSPYAKQKNQKAKWPHKNVSKNCDNTMIADRLRAVSFEQILKPEIDHELHNTMIKYVYAELKLKHALRPRFHIYIIGQHTCTS